MTYPAQLPALDAPHDPDGDHDPALINAYATGEFARPAAARYDGWTAEKQRIFLSAVAEGQNVARAAGAAGMSRQSAYALRNAARGGAFALGWDAAHLRARDVLADEMLDRALHGVREHVTNGDGSITERFRYDNRHGMQVLARLDRLADAPADPARSAASGGANGGAARLIAAEFEAYLDLIARDGGPARAGVFLGARLGMDAAEPAGEDDLAPIRALARADRWLRTRTDLADPLAAGLDPARRADWTAADWAQAEAAGLVQLAPPAPDPADESCQLRQLHEEEEGSATAVAAKAFAAFVWPEDRPEPVWWDENEDRWATRFPPADPRMEDFDNRFGPRGYQRELTEEEAAVMERDTRIETMIRRRRGERERDAWFAAEAAIVPAGATPAMVAAADGGDTYFEGDEIDAVVDRDEDHAERAGHCAEGCGVECAEDCADGCADGCGVDRTDDCVEQTPGDAARSNSPPAPAL
jgi:hypothetical protein